MPYMPNKKRKLFDFIEDTKVSMLHRSVCRVHLRLPWRGAVNSVVLPVSAKSGMKYLCLGSRDVQTA